MDKPTPDLDWNHARALLATVEAGSLSAAARRLGLTQPTLGRQVAALEHTLGVTLFDRVGKTLVLTQAGQELISPLRAMGEAADRLALMASLQSQAIEGLVRVTASDAFAYYVLPALAEKLRTVAPGIVLDVLASNEVEDLLRRKADIAIRHVQPRQPELIARRCADDTARLYATPRYLDRLGRPRTADGFAAADFVGYSGSTEVMLNELRAHGLPLSERNFPLRSNSGLVAWRWVQRGMGIGVMLDAVARATPEVEEAWPDFAGVAVPTWLATHRELRTSRRIRLVFDLLAEQLSSRQPGAPSLAP